MMIKRAQERDFLVIAALDREAWKGNRAGEFIPDGEHAWRHWVEHALVFVAREAGGEGEDAATAASTVPGEAATRVVGAALAFPCDSGAWCVHKLFVEPARRGVGIGGRLLAALLAELDRRKLSCFLTVDPENRAAIALYEARGFTDKRLVKGYYRANEDRYVMSRWPVPSGG